MSPSTALGTLYGVGVGPGDPELLTLKAVGLIGNADVVAYPIKANGESRSLALGAPYLRSDVIHYPLVMDFAPDRFNALAAYRKGAVALGEHLANGRTVVVLCEGDPMLYGSFSYLMEQVLDLNPEQPVVVVPGITSPMACAALALRPLAQGDEILLTVPATLSEPRLIALLAHCDSAVVMKVGRHLDKVCRALLLSGMSAGAVCVTEVGHAHQRVLTLDRAMLKGVPYFSLVLAHRKTLL